MTLTIELTPEEEARLRLAAEAQGKPIADVARALLDQGLPPLPMTGKQIRAYWKRVGALGVFADRPDSPEYARQLRQEAETRERGA